MTVKSCSSSLGMQGGEQIIKLNRVKGCAKNPGVIAHEILHALGFHHMQSHTNRDKFIKIYWDNIEAGNKNYKLTTAEHTSNFNTKYDFYSIMHYPPFIADGIRVIKPKTKYRRFEQFMGQRAKLSTGDIERLKNMYKCGSEQISAVVKFFSTTRRSFITSKKPVYRSQSGFNIERNNDYNSRKNDQIERNYDKNHRYDESDEYFYD